VTGKARLIMCLVGVLLTILGWVVVQYTSWGLAISAVGIGLAGTAAFISRRVNP